MNTSPKITKHTFSDQLKRMLHVDIRRMARSKVFYITIACALLMPILMTVMMTMMDGSESVNQQTGEVTVIEGPENAWQSIGTLPGGETLGGSDVFAMCNINMAFMGACVFICLFITDDFRSGYAKNLFTVRSRKADYVISKSTVGSICGALMLIAYLLGTMLGGAISGLSFELAGFGLTTANIVFCIISKILLMPVFISIFVLVSVAAKQRAWLAICGSLAAGMLLFMMVTVITPLNSGALNILLSLAGATVFSLGLGVAACAILRKTSLV